MKFSLNFIRSFNQYNQTAGDVAAIGVDKLVEKIGAQLGAVDEVIDIGSKYKDIVVVKVVKREKHPDADKLSVCMIDAGRGDNVQVVCGAPNVREGMLAAWLPPGSIVPSTVGKEPFVLEARELRGVISNGMLASPKELELGDSHEGILEIDEGTEPGADFAEVTGLKDDVVLDIENKMFTHRPDCFGYIGIARELAGIQQMPFKSPDWYVPAPEFPAIEAEKLPLTVKNEVPELAPRFTAIAMSGVKVGPSPLWLQVELAKVGQKSINNIVDYTNWFMLLTGQPLHAYDYDKVKALSDGDAAIVVRKPAKGEKIKLLNGKEVEPRSEAVMIATDKQLIGIGGVMGGSQTEVDDDTRNIILECANFDMYSIRRTSMEHGLFTDAVTRFTKGQSPLQCLTILARMVDAVREHAGGKAASPVVDIFKGDASAAFHVSEVAVAPDFINSRLGLDLSYGQIEQLLKNVEFGMEIEGGKLVVYVPFWRTDIKLPEDVVEEVGRLYGYDHLPLELPKRDLTPTNKDSLLELKAKIRAALSKAGANEVLTYSFVHGDLLDKVGQDKSKALQVANALSPDLQYYRPGLTPSLLDKVHPNIKAGYGHFALFELGKGHGHDIPDPNEPDLPWEEPLLGLVVAADNKAGSRIQGAAYYQARRYFMNLLGDLNIPSNKVELKRWDQAKDFDSQVGAPFEPGRTAGLYVDGELLGFIGEYRAAVRKSLKLPDFCAGFEVNTEVLMSAIGGSGYAPLPRFPKVTQDITLKVPAKLTYQELFDFFWSELDSTRPEKTLATVGPVDIYQKEDDDQHRQVTLRLSIASYERTLTDAEVNKLLDDIAAAAKGKLKAERV